MSKWYYCVTLESRRIEENWIFATSRLNAFNIVLSMHQYKIPECVVAIIEVRPLSN